MAETIDAIPKVDWDFEGIHYFDNGPLTVQYLFVLDALNFCFWPGTIKFQSFHMILMGLCIILGLFREAIRLNIFLFWSEGFVICWICLC